MKISLHMGLNFDEERRPRWTNNCTYAVRIIIFSDNGFSTAFQTTPHLLKILEEIAGLHARIQQATVGVSWVPALQKEATIRQAHGSTAIEGNPLTLAEVKILAEGGDLPHAKPRAVQEVLNYFAVLRFIEKTSRVETIKDKDIFKLHSIIGQRGALDGVPWAPFARMVCGSVITSRLPRRTFQN